MEEGGGWEEGEGGGGRLGVRWGTGRERRREDIPSMYADFLVVVSVIGVHGLRKPYELWRGRLYNKK